MSQAYLTLFFCKNLSEAQNKGRKIYEEFILEGESFSTGQPIIEKIISFNKDEELSGLKVCQYELKIKDKVNKPESKKGFIELYFGNNIGYCFIDSKGVTFELSFLFLNEKNKLENVLKIQLHIQ